MAKQMGGKPQIDEDFMKELISQGLPVKKQEMPTVAETKVETPDTPANVPEHEPKPETAKEEKLRKNLPAERKVFPVTTGKPTSDG